ncbi:MAG: PIN domain-containing protein [Gammaproteobacteria bacterium]
MLGLTPAHYRQARDGLIERRVPLRTLDALHFALAHTSNARLVSADGILASAARKHGVVVRYFTG